MVMSAKRPYDDNDMSKNEYSHKNKRPLPIPSLLIDWDSRKHYMEYHEYEEKELPPLKRPREIPEPLNEKAMILSENVSTPVLDGSMSFEESRLITELDIQCYDNRLYDNTRPDPTGLELVPYYHNDNDNDNEEEKSNSHVNNKGNNDAHGINADNYARNKKEPIENRNHMMPLD